MDNSKIKELIAEMTLEEKASLCSGVGFWHTKTIERLGIEPIMVSDGPIGLRKQEEGGGVNDSIRAICFPAGCGMAASFDRNLMHRLGETLGKECRAENISVLLGPAVNIKRSPLCGRNFEYYSEDPYLASEMAAAYIQGVQEQGVGTSIKHFAANNQETRRMSVSAVIDERALHEIYLAAFEGAVRKSHPWTVMSSYNKINGTYVGENHELLTDILRDKWGFDGVVVSDWGAVSNRVEALKAGLDLEMPDSGGYRDGLIVKAVKDQTLSEEVLDRAVCRILTLVYKGLENRSDGGTLNFEADHEEAEKIAEETIVLLRNEDDILPISKSSRVAFIGKYADKPRYQGGGSSHINTKKVTSALEAAKEMGIAITYAQGFEDGKDETNPELEEQAIEVAKACEVAVIFVGLPDNFESEGFDRNHMRMPTCQTNLIRRVAAVQPNTVVVLHNGSPVEMPWADKTKGILEAYLGGEAVGMAEVRLLFGDANPCAKLAETFPYRLEDTPSFLTGFGEGNEVRYAEGIFTGYRYYDRKKVPVRYPFGYGKSYTTFEYGNLRLDRSELTDKEVLKVEADVTNTGDRAGKEIVELYVTDVNSSMLRPEKELKGFEKVLLEPGETKTVTFMLDYRAFAYYEPRIKDFMVESGEFKIHVGKSSMDIELTETVTVKGTVRIPVVYTDDTVMCDIPGTPEAKKAIAPLENPSGESKPVSEAEADAISEEMNEAMNNFMPLRALLSLAPGMTAERIQEAVDNLNKLQ